MYKNCNTEQSALRQQQLEDCLLKNMLLRPYAEITISDLCEQSSISRKSFYRYFTNKDSCLTSLLDRKMMESSRYEYSGTFAGSDIEKDFLRVLSFWKENEQFLRVLISNNLTHHLLDRMIQHIINEEHIFLRHIGVTDPNNSSEPLLFSTSGFFVLLLQWAQTGFQKPVEEMAASIAALFTRPLVAQVTND